MRLSNSVIFLVLAGSMAVNFACGGNAGDPAPVQPSIPEPVSDVPYPTREPDRYRATAVIIAGGTERTAEIARDGGNLRVDLAPGTERHLVVLRTDRHYVASPVHRIYAERPTAETVGAEEFINDLTIRLLHRREDVVYEPLGSENGLAKYRVRMGTGETVVFVDERLGMPVAQEFYSSAEGARELQYRFELRDVSLEPGTEVFRVPPEYRKVAIEEFYRITRRG